MNMHSRGLTRHTLPLLACVVLLLLAAACQPAVVPTGQPSLSPTASQASPAVTGAASDPAAETSGILSFDLSGVAQSQSAETIAAVPANPDGPWWEALPEHQLVALQGYPVGEHLLQPQIFVYPVSELAQFNEVGGQMAADLQSLLQTRQPGDRLPYMPLYNSAQVFHAQVQYLDFKNGSGVRYLTQFDQAPYPVNNFELVYTFQGMTGDGKYYVAAVLPVTHPELPDTQEPFAQDAEELSNFSDYLAKTVDWLNGQPANSFTPDLSALDALVQSIEIK